jgi:hypothetical protein
MVSFHTKVTIRILAKIIITDMEISTSVMASDMTLVRLSTNLVIIKNMTTDIASDMMAMDTMATSMVTDTALAMKDMDTVFTILHITLGHLTNKALIMPMKAGQMITHTVLIILFINIQVSHSWLHFLNKVMTRHTTMLHITYHRITIFHTMQHHTMKHLTTQLHFMN